MKRFLLPLAAAALVACQPQSSPPASSGPAEPGAPAAAANTLPAAERQPWLTSLPEALALAKAQGKHVFINFTGSDW